MKIIYLTDIHDALRELKTILTSTEADLYLLCGDILYKAFYDEDKIYQFVCLQEEFYSLARERKEKIYPFDLATNLLRFPDRYEQGRSDDWKLKAAEYRLLFAKASKTMKEKYALIEDLILKYAGAACYMLPGNYDIDLRYTDLDHRDLHQKKKKFDDLLFAGYGGAPVATSGIPEKLAVVYHESSTSQSFYSEPQDLFDEYQPDVMVLHNPVYGYFDRIPAVGHVGSVGLRNYLDDHRPVLVTSGHVHEDYGIRVKHGTVFLNTSNFGGVDSPYGWQAGGTYGELYLEGRSLQKLVLRRMVEGVFHDLMEVEQPEPGKLVGRRLAGAAESCLDLSVIVRNPDGEPVESD